MKHWEAWQAIVHEITKSGRDLATEQLQQPPCLLKSVVRIKLKK